MSDCVFCKIIAGEIPSTNVYKDDHATAFRDINPAAPTHILIVPNKHIDSVNDLSANDEKLIGHLFLVAKDLAKKEGIAESGYRLVMNTNQDGGQTVFHIHLHLLGGRPMKGFG
jgi:histidine triad (HIT) family protein